MRYTVRLIEQMICLRLANVRDESEAVRSAVLLANCSKWVDNAVDCEVPFTASRFEYIIIIIIIIIITWFMV